VALKKAFVQAWSGHVHFFRFYSAQCFTITVPPPGIQQCWLGVIYRAGNNKPALIKRLLANQAGVVIEERGRLNAVALVPTPFPFVPLLYCDSSCCVYQGGKKVVRGKVPVCPDCHSHENVFPKEARD
jgi:hypothetical protein